MESFKPLIAKVAAGATLTRAEAVTAFDSMLSGEVTPSQMGGFLMALRVRGESVDEITGAVEAMRAKMLGVKAPADAIDIALFPRGPGQPILGAGWESRLGWRPRVSSAASVRQGSVS